MYIYIVRMILFNVQGLVGLYAVKRGGSVRTLGHFKWRAA